MRRQVNVSVFQCWFELVKWQWLHVNNVGEVGHTVFSLQWRLSQTINGFDDVKFEAASVLAELFEQQGQPTHSKHILRKAIELSQHTVYWHCRLIFQLAVSIK